MFRGVGWGGRRMDLHCLYPEDCVGLFFPTTSNQKLWKRYNKKNIQSKLEPPWRSELRSGRVSSVYTLGTPIENANKTTHTKSFRAIFS